jgi:hypothetical protein
MMRNRIIAIVGTFGITLAIGAISLAASDDVNKTPAKPAAQAAKPSAAPAPAPASPGVRVYIDPATGKIREPEQEEVQQLSPAAPAAARRLAAPAAVTMVGPGNARGMKLSDDQMVYSVATRKADGTISFECVTGAESANKALAGKSAERGQTNDK